LGIRGSRRCNRDKVVIKFRRNGAEGDWLTKRGEYHIANKPAIHDKPDIEKLTKSIGIKRMKHILPDGPIFCPEQLSLCV